MNFTNSNHTHLYNNKIKPSNNTNPKKFKIQKKAECGKQIIAPALS